MEEPAAGELVFKVAPRLERDLGEHLRNALLNRYPFILLSRDLVRYYELQMDCFARQGLRRRFVMPLGYYVTNFYLHVWGLLDQLTVIANLALGLGLRDRECGIAYKSSAGVGGAATQPWEVHRALDITESIPVMADMRHAARN